MESRENRKANRPGLRIAAAAASALGVLLMKQLPDHTVRVLVMCCIPVAAVLPFAAMAGGRGHKRFTARNMMLLGRAGPRAVGFYDLGWSGRARARF